MCDDKNGVTWRWTIGVAVAVLTAFTALCYGAIFYFRSKWHLGLVASLLLLGVLSTGCISPEMRTSVTKLRAGWTLYRAATIPSPAYVDSGVAVRALGQSIDDDLKALETATK
jgi:hypothetical protein